MKKILTLSAIYLLSISLVFVSCSNSENKDNKNNEQLNKENKTELLTDNDKKNSDNTNVKGNPNSEFEADLVGTWDLVDDEIFGNIDEYLKIEDNILYKEKHNMAAGNPVFGKDGQIWYEKDGQKAYLYDYVIEGDKLYFLEQKSEEFKNPKTSPKTFVLTKRK